jgi:heme-degrading monooxygenase HmoA
LPDARVLRLFQFRPVRSAFDGVLRGVVPELRGLPGLVDVQVGRRGPDELGPRLIATVWSSHTAMLAGFAEGGECGDDSDEPVFHPEFIGETTQREHECLPLVISVPFDGSRPARILRTFRGRVRPGERDAYIEKARLGFLADIDAGRGPLAIHLGTVPAEDGLVTLTVWDSWSALEAATGGDVRRPMATRHPELILAWDVAHYEVVDG